MKIEIEETPETIAADERLAETRRAWAALSADERRNRIAEAAALGRLDAIKAYRATSGAELGEAVRTIDAAIAAAAAAAPLTLGQRLRLPAGHKVGMGRLRHAVEATISRVDTDDHGRPFYAVRYMSTKETERSTWLTHVEAIAYAR